MIAAVCVALFVGRFAAVPAPSPQSRDLVRVHEVRVPAGERVSEAVACDVDRDGTTDLICVTRGARRDEDGDERAQDGPRRVRIWFARKDASAGPRFGAGSDHLVALTPDVIAVGVGDVDPAPGREVLLWNGGGVFAWRTGVQDGVDIQRVGDAAPLWQRTSERGALVWRGGARDLDGDGLDDVLTPSVDGYDVLLQRRTGGESTFEAVPRLVVPRGSLDVLGRDDVRTSDEFDATSLDERARGSFELRFGDGGGARVARAAKTLLDVSARVPAPLTADLDGDGRLDVFAQTARELLVWTALSRGGEADVRLDLPVDLDRGRRLDVSYSSTLGDLDGDGRADVVVFAGDKRSRDVRTQVLVYRSGHAAAASDKTVATDGNLFGDAPSQMLVLAGFGGRARLVDVDGDGFDDLVAASMRPDLLDVIGGVDELELEILTFLGGPGGLPRRPSLSARLGVGVDSLFEGYALVPDATGDGVLDLLVRRKGDVALYGVRPDRKDRGALELLPKPLFTLSVDDEDEVQVQSTPEGPRALVRGKTRVRLLEVGR